MIRFQQLNLVDPQWSVRGPFDAIFCRNVMIYFDRDTQLAVLRRFAPLLKPDGLRIHVARILRAAVVDHDHLVRALRTRHGLGQLRI